MSIKAIFSAGVEALTVHGLHQWDYGQMLEITHPDLPAILEVHFAAVGAQDALVRVVEGVVGVAEVRIPDALLEQSRPVLAWVYVVGEASGTTMLTVTLPLRARARPTAAGPIPEAVSDKYTEALGAMNAQVKSLKEGNVVVAFALNAQGAEDAKFADMADEAGRATYDGKGNNIAETYKPKVPATFQPIMYCPFTAGVLYQIKVNIDGADYYTVITVENGRESYASLGSNLKTCYTLIIDVSRTVYVCAVEGDQYLGDVTPTSVMFRLI